MKRQFKKAHIIGVHATRLTGNRRFCVYDL